MKKIIPVAAIMLASITAKAEDLEFSSPFRLPQQFISMTATILVMYLIIRFILSIMRMMLDHKVKGKLLEKDVPENIIVQYLQPAKKGVRNESMKWVTIFTSIGLGLLLISWFEPFGLHSLAIMSFCIAGGFWSYNYFSKRTEKEEDKQR